MWLSVVSEDPDSGPHAYTRSAFIKPSPCLIVLFHEHSTLYIKFHLEYLEYYFLLVLHPHSLSENVCLGPWARTQLRTITREARKRFLL